MESHVKERIVGAAVLVALGVLVIPWILDGPDDVAIESEALPEILLPAAEPITPFRAEIPAQERPVPAVADEAGESASEADAAVDNPTSSQASAEPSQTSPEPSRTAAESAAPPRADSSTTEAVPPPVALASPAAALPDRSGWAVQLGAFGEKANADQLARRVSTYGFDAFVAPFQSNGTTMYRVRVAGFETENQADAAASSISAHSIPARVISPE